MRTPFLGGAYTTRSSVLASNTCINLYPELVPDKSGKVGGFYGTPGLGAVFQDIVGEVRGLWVVGGPNSSFGYLLFAVIANRVYQIDPSYTSTLLGTLPNSTGRVSLCDNGTEILIAHQNGMHYTSLPSGAGGLIPVLNAPRGAICSGLDNFIVFTDGTGGQFSVSRIGNLSSVDPLSTATAEGWPDNCVSILADHREVWLFGTETIEVWGDTGAAFFPLERVSGGFIEQGCAAPYSVAKLDNSVFWLGADRKGNGVVYRSNVYQPERISTHALEFAFNQGPIKDAIGMTYQDEGHSFYLLTFPSLDQTWAYDVSTGLWHQRAYLDRTGTLRRHRANCMAYFAGNLLAGDVSNGKIYRLSLDYATDDGDPIYRERAWSLAENELDIENKKTRIDLLELHCLTGEPEAISYNTILATGSWATEWGAAWGFDWGQSSTQSLNIERLNQVWLEVSGDSGRTWSYRRYQNLGPLGQRFQRLRWRRAGAKRNTNLRIATDMQVPVSFVGAYWNGEVLAV